MTISATKPSSGVVPTWGTDSGVRVEPSSGQKATGWTSGQRPSATEMNWLDGAQCDWLQYLEDASDQLESSKLENTTDEFVGVLTISGSGAGLVTPAVDTDALTVDGLTLLSSRVHMHGSSTNTDTIPDPDTLEPARLVLSNSSATTNTKAALFWLNNGSDSSRDGFVAYTTRLGSGDDNVSWSLARVRDGGAASGEVLLEVDVDDDLVVTQNVRPRGAPVKDAPMTNTLSAVNIPKAWGTINTDGSGGITLTDAFNVDSVAAFATTSNGVSTFALQVTMASPMGDTNYCVVSSLISSTSRAPGACTPHDKSQWTQTDFLLLLAEGGTAVSPGASNARTIFFVVFGRQ